MDSTDNEKLIYKKFSLEKRNMFNNDLNKHFKTINQKIAGLNVLVIGGAGTIGSNYLKQILNYKPRNITIVDINENGLTELHEILKLQPLDYKPEYKTYPVNLLSELE